MKTQKSFIDELSQQLESALPAGFELARDDLERIIKSSVTAALSRMELVTRDEFDVQRAVLLRTREKLEAMTERLAKLEQDSDNP